MVSDDIRSCPECGAEAPDEGKFCPQCAAPLDKRREPVEPPEERTIWKGRYRVKAMAGWLALLLLWWAALAVVWFGSIPNPTRFVQWFFGGLAVVPLLWFIAVYLRRRFRTRYLLTTRRLILKRGLFGRNAIEMDLKQLTDVIVHQKLIHRFVDAGGVTAYSSGEDSMRVDIHGINNPVGLKERIRRAAAEARAGLI